MLIIEAINVKSYGILNLLKYLVDQLDHKKLPYKVYLHSDSSSFFKNPKHFEFVPVKNTALDRRRKLKEIFKEYSPSCLLCFGNFPPSIRPNYPIKIFVSFQNLYLTDKANNFGLTKKEKLNYFLKKLFIKKYANKADLYISPTVYVSEALESTFNISPEKIITIPFFDKGIFENLLEVFKRKKLEKQKNTFIYVSSALPHKNHETLIDAWMILKSKGYNLKLTLSIENKTTRGKVLIDQINQFNKDGGKITLLNENGYTPYEKVLEATYKHEFTIYPSLNETFGYGTIEGVLMGNKLLVSNLDFVNDVTEPSLSFDPNDANNIAEKVIFAVEKELKESKLLFQNKINNLIEQLYNYA